MVTYVQRQVGKATSYNTLDYGDCNEQRNVGTFQHWTWWKVMTAMYNKTVEHLQHTKQWKVATVMFNKRLERHQHWTHVQDCNAQGHFGTATIYEAPKPRRPELHIRHRGRKASYF
jgi:hypothetical protein